MAPIERTDMLRVRMAPEETAMLAALADEVALSASDVVRTLIREAYKAKFGAKKPKSAK